ncbi:transforming growth factor beta activator LRRC32 [Heteronotia binoei]|uniref:transforming growth factor beta activator LRRC32 n=1 Tax=Heteronotia binoei TaxID=13085 RepID=UPI00292E786D|nr:transforming growth factor beta activator LRRC32 [Heteronotia binoei]
MQLGLPTSRRGLEMFQNYGSSPDDGAQFTWKKRQSHESDLLLFLAALNGGISTYRPMEASPCDTKNMVAFCQRRDFHQIPSELYPTVRKIDLSENKLQNITKTPLAFYTSLWYLDLSSNRISYIEPGIFSDMTSLVEISLANNQLYQLAQHNLWVGLLPQVRKLDLSHNSLYNGMAQRFLHQAPSLEYLSLAKNSITEISWSTFQGSPRLVEVDLHSNMIMEIEEGAFEMLSHLSTLNLSMNSLTCIAGFSLKQLQVLDLSRNSIETFHSTESKEEFNLVWLDLSENKLLRFPVLPQANKLSYLNLSKNIMQFLVDSPSDDLDYDWSDVPFALQAPNPTSNKSSPSLSQLLYLDLSYNEIKSLPPKFFASMSTLQFLNLSKNCLQSFVASSELVSLVILDLSSNSLQNLEFDADALSNLRELYLQENHLQGLRSDIFASLSQISLLNLRRNRFRLCSLYSGLAKRRLAGEEDGCVSFVNLPELRYLILADNHLRSLPLYVFHQTQLTMLDLSINRGLQIEAKSLSGLENSLTHLDLHSNGMTTLNIDLPHFTRLRYLNLSDNQLSWLPAWSEDCCVLEILDLRNNSFSSLKSSEIPALENTLQNLYLAGNPLSCCGNIWLSHMIHRATVAIANVDLLKCQYAKSFGYDGEMAVRNIKPEDCEKEDLKKMSVLILLVALLALSLIVIGVGLFCCYRRHKFGRQFKV